MAAVPVQQRRGVGEQPALVLRQHGDRLAQRDGPRPVCVGRPLAGAPNDGSDVTTTPTFTLGTPRELIRVQGPLPGNPPQWKNVTSDGQRFIFAVPVQTTTTSR